MWRAAQQASGEWLLFTDADVRRLKEFGDHIDRTFETNLAQSAWKTAKRPTNGEIVIDMKKPVRFNRVMLGESMSVGQRVESFAVDTWIGSAWKQLASATTIGYRRLLQTPAVRTRTVRVRILQTRAAPSIATFGLFFDDSQDQ